MPGQGAKVGALFLGGGGILLLWSGLTGKSWSAVLKDLISGKNPATLPQSQGIAATSFMSYGYGTPGAGPAPGKLASVSGPSGATGTVWSSALLKALGAPQTNANIVSLNAWQNREGGGGANNPLNTTLNCCGGTNLAGNSAGVKNYPSFAAGVQANASTIRGGYPLIYMALLSGRGLCGGGFSNEFFTWSGSKPGSSYTSVC